MKEVTREPIIDMACSEDCTTIVLGSQDGNVWALDQQGRVLWTYPAGSWINGVGVSRDGSVIAAGALDGNLYILNHNGSLLARTKTQSIIQQRSVAVSGDGKRVVAADQFTLNGYDILGSSEVTLIETVTLPPLITTTNPTPVTTRSIAIPAPEVTTLAATTGTPKSALTPFAVFVAVAGLFLLVRKRPDE
jgi:WD40 repeat protein